MKRKMALMLAVVLIVSAGLMAYATGPDDAAGMMQAVSAEQELQESPVMGLQPVELKTQDEQPPESGQEPGEEQNSAEAGNQQGTPVVGEDSSAAGEGSAEGTLHSPEVTQEPGTSESTEASGEVSDPDKSGETEDSGTEQKPDGEVEAENPGTGSSQEPDATQNPAGPEDGGTDAEDPSGTEEEKPGTTQSPAESEEDESDTTKEPDGSGTAEPGTVPGTDAEAGQDPTGKPLEPGATAQPGESPEPGVDQDGQQPEEGDVPEVTAPILPENAGQVDVSIGAALILERSVEFTIELKSESGEVKEGSITLGNSSGEESQVSFEGLSNGRYTLTVSGSKFATYTQDINVEGKGYAVKLATGFLAGIDYVEGKAHPGVLVIGDVNGDGMADDEDRNELVNAIDQATRTGSSDADAFDLNGDSKVNLVDLEYFAKAYQDPRDKQAGVEISVPRAAIKPSVGENTAVEGELDSVLKQGGSVTLKPAGGGEISETNPVALQFDFAEAAEAVQADGIVIETGSDNPITNAVISIDYVDENGVTEVRDIPLVEGVHFLLEDDAVRAEADSNGNIHLHLGGQVAVKRVTLFIKGTKNTNLAEISKVEFVNGMETRIPEPEMDIPENMVVVAGSKLISLSWDPCVNVTGYEVSIRHGDAQETKMVAANSIDITSFNEKELTNYEDYYVKVQSVNGTWRSGYCDEQKATPMPKSRPDKPDMVKANGQYRSVAVSWKKMDDTLYYNVFYKESSASEYQKVEGIKENSYLINGLEDLTSYSVYVTGVNELGESDPSLTAVATTTDLDPAVMPKYKLLNTGEEGQKGDHIIAAGMLVSNVNSMENSPLDEGQGTAWGTVDKDAGSYYLRNDWDDGASHTDWNGRGLTYEFDKAYEMDTIAFYAFNSQDEGYATARIRFWDESGNIGYRNGTLQKKMDAKSKVYYVLKLSEPANAKKLQLYIGRGSSYVRRITVAEVYFYHYDSIYDDIMALYQDDLHTVLKPEVTQENIDVLRTRINTPDEASGEYHPDRELLEQELKTAEDILKENGLGEPVRIHSTITTNDVSRGFSGLNAWQPLGVTAAAQETIVLYVGHSTKKAGENTNLQLVATQYNAEANALASTVGTLKIGRNEVTIPKIWSLDFESGGALYVQYTGNNANDDYAVRVVGGVQVPKLDLYKVTDKEERLARTKAYVQELETYVGKLEENHKTYHEGSSNALVSKYAYDEPTCILGASDIMLDTMMFSLPASRIWAGSGSAGASIEERAQKILTSMDAMEDMMYLFYQHKGLNNSAAKQADRIPLGHQNIRYQRMFAKAFMYAAGNHIGIGWGSTAGMVASSPVVADENGKWKDGSYFGWGIAHEIGHCINQGAYAVAEITNNYFSVLAQARDNNDSVRFKYENVYKKVTSGSKGRASNVFTQLGMYWQLHLAYDNGYNYKTYENYEEQLANLFFARVDTYARDVSKAPAPGGVKLALAGNGDQALMRLACAAAEKNILEFFERWGMTPDEGTRSYAGQFAPETRAIYYVNDDSRVYRLENAGTGSILGTVGAVDAVGDTIAATISATEPNRVDIALSSKNIPEDDVLGYEIVRCTISGGDPVKEIAGFAAGSTCTFSDIISTMNNRVVYYEITLIDKYLNRSAVKTLDPVKIEHDGSMDKTFWTVSTNNLTVEGETEDISCNPDDENVFAKERDKLIDNNTGTVYTATTADETSEIILEFGKLLTVAGFKITPGEGFSGTYEILVCRDDVWRTVAKGTAAEGVQTIHFANAEGKYVSTYEATAAKLVMNTAKGSQVSIAELDVLGVTGDNVDFRRTDGEESVVVIGKLSQEFKFGGNEGDVIPEGSIVFAGSYKGNAAYNVVILFDQDGNIVGKVSEDEVKSDQIILADVPEGDDLIQNVADGIWIYWVGPETDLSGVKKVRAELYRVNKAESNEGQRLVSDSLFEEMPDELPEVSLDGVAEPWK